MKKNNMRKIAISSALFTSVLHAANMSGSYVGIHVGDANIFAKYIFQNDISSNGAAHILDVSRPQIGGANFAGGVYFGVGHLFNNPNTRFPYYLGVEAAVNYIPTQIKNSGASATYLILDSVDKMYAQDSHSINFTNNVSYTAAFKPGVQLLEDTLLFGLIGLDDASFKASVAADGVASLSDGSYYVADPYQHSFSKNKVGLLLGAGMEMQMIKNFFASLKYTYSFYGSLEDTDTAHVSYTDAGHPVNVILNHTYSFKDLSRGVFLVGVTYHF